MCGVHDAIRVSSFEAVNQEPLETSERVQREYCVLYVRSRILNRGENSQTYWSQNTCVCVCVNAVEKKKLSAAFKSKVILVISLYLIVTTSMHFYIQFIVMRLRFFFSFSLNVRITTAERKYRRKKMRGSVRDSR